MKKAHSQARVSLAVSVGKMFYCGVKTASFT